MELFGRWNEVLMNIDVPQVRSVRGRCISVINTCLATKGKSKLKKREIRPENIRDRSRKTIGTHGKSLPFPFSLKLLMSEKRLSY